MSVSESLTMRVPQLGRQVIVLDEVAALLRIVLHRQHVLLAEAQAADELIPLDELLHDHRQQARLVVVVDQLVERAADVHVLPAAAVRVLEDARHADVVDDRLPVERILEVAQALVVLDARDVLLVRQRHRLGAGDAEPRGERRAEELVVGRPHERVVDDRRALQHGVLEVGPVVRHLVRDAIDDHVVRHGLVHRRAAELHELGGHALVAAVDFVDEPRRKRPLAADDQTDLVHVPLSLVTVFHNVERLVVAADVDPNHVAPVRPVVRPAIPDAQRVPDALRPQPP